MPPPARPTLAEVYGETSANFRRRTPIRRFRYTPPPPSIFHREVYWVDSKVEETLGLCDKRGAILNKKGIQYASFDRNWSNSQLKTKFMEMFAGLQEPFEILVPMGTVLMTPATDAPINGQSLCAITPNKKAVYVRGPGGYSYQFEENSDDETPTTETIETPTTETIETSDTMYDTTISEIRQEHDFSLTRYSVQWLHRDNGDDYHVVTEEFGGGPRDLEIQSTSDRMDLLRAARELYFPNRESLLGGITEFNFTIFNDDRTPISDELPESGAEIFLATTRLVVNTIPTR